jgi:hypothetical protein
MMQGWKNIKFSKSFLTALWGKPLSRLTGLWINSDSERKHLISLQIRTFCLWFMHSEWSVHANNRAECLHRLYSLVSPTTTTLSHRKSASVGTFCDSRYNKDTDKRNEYYQSTYNFTKSSHYNRRQFLCQERRITGNGTCFVYIDCLSHLINQQISNTQYLCHRHFIAP